MIRYKHPYDTISQVLEKLIVKYIGVTGFDLFSNETAPVCGFAQGMGGRSSKTSITFNFDFISQLLQSMLITHNQSCIRHLYNKPKTMPYHLLVCIIMSVRQAKIAKIQLVSAYLFTRDLFVSCNVKIVSSNAPLLAAFHRLGPAHSPDAAITMSPGTQYLCLSLVWYCNLCCHTGP